jgi:DNA-binding CsgD family transcriptional regulator
MNPSLSHEQHLAVLACVGALYRCRSLADFPTHALAALAPVVPSIHSSFNEVNLPQGRLRSVLDRPLARLEESEAAFSRYRDQHPLVRYVEETGDGQAIKFSDFLSVRAYRRLDLYRVLYRPLGVEEQMSITIRSDAGVIIAIAFTRARRDFSESERVMLNLVRPHLLQAYAQVEEIAGRREEQEDLRTALRETGHGVIALDASGGIVHATPGAPECLARYAPMRGATVIPRTVRNWLAARTETPLVLAGPDSRLIVRRPTGAVRRLLLLSEESLPALPTGARLTPREGDVLRWLAGGKTNREIAAILKLAPGTVNRHVERILAKLGAENRTAAAAIASTLGYVVGP